MVDYLFIQNDADLKRVSEEFRQNTEIAVDLEADSMFHFKEKICLIQMASSTLTVIIDPLNIDDMSPLKPVFDDPGIRKILHGSDYDIRSLYRDYAFEVNNLFDTELASRFLGVNETGLGSVLENRFDIHLDKTFQKKDWSQRPLSDEMIEYGACDVIHLLPLARILDSELEEKKRASWVREECDLLSQVRCPEPNGDPLFLRVKGAGRLDRLSLAVLENLLHMRMHFAEKKDKPVFKVIGNASLLDISRRKPKTLEQLIKDKSLSKRQVDAFGKAVIHEVSEALKIPEEDLPSYPRKRKPAVKPDVPKRFDRLKEWRDKVAQDLSIDPPMLFNKALLTEIATRNPRTMDDFANVNGIKNWQINEFGADILKKLTRH